MTAEEFRAAREQLGLTQEEFGRRLGFVGQPLNIGKSIRRLESGQRAIDGAVSRLVKVLLVLAPSEERKKTS